MNDEWIQKKSRRNKKNIFELRDENRDTTNDSLWDSKKAIPRGKFTALSSYIKIIGRYQMNNLTLYLKTLDKRTTNQHQNE